MKLTDKGIERIRQELAKGVLVDHLAHVAETLGVEDDLRICLLDRARERDEANAAG